MWKFSTTMVWFGLEEREGITSFNPLLLRKIGTNQFSRLETKTIGWIFQFARVGTCCGVQNVGATQWS
jgi:hypothetical protein